MLGGRVRHASKWLLVAYLAFVFINQMPRFLVASVAPYEISRQTTKVRHPRVNVAHSVLVEDQEEENKNAAASHTIVGGKQIATSTADTTTTTTRPTTHPNENHGAKTYLFHQYQHMLHSALDQQQHQEDPDKFIRIDTSVIPIERIHVLGERNSGTNLICQWLDQVFSPYGGPYDGESLQLPSYVRFDRNIPVVRYKHMVRCVVIETWTGFS